ncbi:hypothetical protein GMRT_11131 [Giardia muris]|uniref:Uncharacterized protein n=1 Tax=Giardia muris TaxID=5742 RepID=A0A4Z1SSN0_GIAMU|nr:hypothetical protein GMRT_11131 [Giardia muris]|eukprot:TNJ28926.1 hypothetical protein GMRT_11131 [Giardia muris]
MRLGLLLTVSTLATLAVTGLACVIAQAIPTLPLWTVSFVPGSTFILDGSSISAPRSYSVTPNQRAYQFYACQPDLPIMRSPLSITSDMTAYLSKDDPCITAAVLPGVDFTMRIIGPKDSRYDPGRTAFADVTISTYTMPLSSGWLSERRRKRTQVRLRSFHLKDRMVTFSRTQSSYQFDSVQDKLCDGEGICIIEICAGPDHMPINLYVGMTFGLFDLSLCTPLVGYTDVLDDYLWSMESSTRTSSSGDTISYRVFNEKAIVVGQIEDYAEYLLKGRVWAMGSTNSITIKSISASNSQLSSQYLTAALLGLILSSILFVFLLLFVYEPSPSPWSHARHIT